uniref:Complement factor I n=1 Tax=Sphenodon punctatus TaxID=8508 RepID=A0A8D0GWN7_SPHPU
MKAAKIKNPVKRVQQVQPVEQKTYLIKECLSHKFTLNSCKKVFCQPWQRCVDGDCICKIPYQCPKNSTLTICATNKRPFRNYCQLKSYECQHSDVRFMNKGNCNSEENFHISLEPENSTESFVQVKLVNHTKELYLCNSGWSAHEANVVCRHLGFSEWPHPPLGVRAGVRWGEPTSDSPDCLQATCRGTETSLAECTLIKRSQVNGDKGFARVVCYTTPRVEEFRCVNGKCIPLNETCNGINDCGDLSDELCCKECRDGSFHCKSDVCIPREHLCNKRKVKTFLPQIQCGIANHTVTRRKRILGGSLAVKSQFPWQVAIRDNEKVICGGIYIGGCWILTAAHCVRSSRVNHYLIWTGLLDTIKYGSRVETFRLKQLIIHENYNASSYWNDIALLEMRNSGAHKTCLVDNSFPACVPWSEYMFRPGQECKVSGWGLGDDFAKQYELKWGYINLLPNCSDLYKGRFLSGMECAGTHDGSIDACKGDSGGPLVCLDSDNVAYVWGVVSWGDSCGVPESPGVYTKVATYFDWISRHVGRSLISRYNV